MAHITGGGLVDNVPRMLPKGVDAVFDCRAWEVPPIFRFFQEVGKVDAEEMDRVFNMGIGYVLCVRPKDLAKTMSALAKAKARPIVIGQIAKGIGRTRLENLG